MVALGLREGDILGDDSVNEIVNKGLGGRRLRVQGFVMVGDRLRW